MTDVRLRTGPAGFIEWRPTEIGLGFSLSVDRDHGPPDYAPRWFPNVWLHLGPVIVGIAYSHNRLKEESSL